MFSFFKRSDKVPEPAGGRPGSQTKRPVKNVGMDGRESLPLPQVIEGNEDSDWAMWEDSVLEQDSRSHPQFRDTVPSNFLVEEPATADSHAEAFSKPNKHAT